MERTGEVRKARVATEVPEIAADLAEVVIDPPDRTFAETAYLDLGDRRVELRFLGLGHTDHDIVIRVPDAGVTVRRRPDRERRRSRHSGTRYPLDWPETAFRVAELAQGVVVPGHGDHGGAGFADAQAVAFDALAELARRVHHGELTLDDAVAATPVPGVSGRGGAAAPRARAAAAPRRARLTGPLPYSPIRTIQRPRASPATIAIERLVERVEGDLGAVHGRGRADGGPWPGDPTARAAGRSAC